MAYGDDDYYSDCASSSDLDPVDDYDNEADFAEADSDEAETVSRDLKASVITKETLIAAQREDLQKVMDWFALCEQHARTLLIYYRWHVEEIFEMLERKGREKLFREAGVAIMENKGDILDHASSSVTCGTCFDEVSLDAVVVMDCGHYFCNNCWTEHFIIRINEGQSRRIRCMAYKCNAICDEAIIRSLVSKKRPNIAERFDRFLLESYVDDNDNIKWCPSTPHCGNAIRVKGNLKCEVIEVACTCGLKFCFNCSLEAHSPCSCLMWGLWATKCEAESLNATWVVINTKPCPKCYKAVEKNGGCNLVVCICGQAFCWLCGGPTGRVHTWSSIDGHSCNRYKGDEQNNAELAKKNHYRFVHYHNRYRAHTDSINQETNLREAFQQRTVASVNKETSVYEDYSWALDGISRLFRSRRVLSYTYPFAYYMFGGEVFRQLSDKEREMKKNLFEDQQQQLESNVEKLSMYLERDFESLTEQEFSETRNGVIGLSKIVDFLCKQMYQCVENDIMEPLGTAAHKIAPYQSNGAEKAPELAS